jgi:hypothetical protein
VEHFAGGVADDVGAGGVGAGKDPVAGGGAKRAVGDRVLLAGGEVDAEDRLDAVRVSEDELSGEGLVDLAAREADGGNLLLTNRDTATNGSLRMITRAHLTAAYAGTPFAVLDPSNVVYSDTGVRTSRDIAGNVPEPSGLAPVALAGVGLAGRGVRRRN